jgi:hypothetical protein
MMQATTEQRSFIMAVSYSGALQYLDTNGIDIGQDFFTLSFFQVLALVEMAKIQRYYKPKNANGSRARYYFAALKRDYNKSRKGV